MQDFEKLGAFYLGRPFDLATRTPHKEPLLYDARDLTTHGVCVGMTGSGKTGLCLALIEEAAIDGIPTIAIDPKGDLANLMLTFPDLSPTDFAPWIDEDEAARKGRTPAQHAEAVATTWREGLAEWGQDGERIRRFRDAVDITVYTPGSRSGIPLTILRSFAAPPPALLDDEDALRERVLSSVGGLLSLLGIDADPVRSREHILLSTILDRAWRAGRSFDLASLIHEIQQPPFDRIGVMDLESFFASKDRFQLAMLINNLLASPGFAAWMDGEPMDISRMLMTPEGKPRISIVSIAHLSDTERMFFVTLLLSEVLAWVRTQPGTSSLRALLYMDEIFGFFPPTANPPSKTPMLTLLKQARAFGLGVLLATQNPVDLDYKGLSNAGTWFIGRLQTERDKMRLLDGLEGVQGGAGFDRLRMDEVLSSLGSRVFLMHNVHEDGPIVFQTRWAMSYLRGPLTRVQIQRLMAPQKAAISGSDTAPTQVATPPVSAPPLIAAISPALPATTAPAPGMTDRTAVFGRPLVPPDVPQWFSRIDADATSAQWRPMLVGQCQIHFASARHDIDAWQTLTLALPFPDAGTRLPLDQAMWMDFALPLSADAPGATRFDTLPGPAMQARNYTTWQSHIKDHLCRTRVLSLWHAPDYKATSRPGESRGEFQARLALMARERRDAEIARLRAKYGPRVERIEGRIRAAEDRVAREEAQYESQQMDTTIAFGSTLLGALLGRKRMGAGTLGRAASAARSYGRQSREQGDIERARQELFEQRQALQELAAEFSRAEMSLTDPTALVNLVEVTVRLRPSDVSIDRLGLTWTPWVAAPDGTLAPAFLSGPLHKGMPHAPS